MFCLESIKKTSPNVKKNVTYIYILEKKVPQSNFLSTVIFNLTLSLFLALFSNSLELVCRYESVQQRNHCLVMKKSIFLTVFGTNLLIPLSH